MSSSASPPRKLLRLSAPPPWDPEPPQLESKGNSLESGSPSESEPLPLSAPPPSYPEPPQLESKGNSLDSGSPSESEPLPLSAPPPSDPEPPQRELKEKSLDSESPSESDYEASDGESSDASDGESSEASDGESSDFETVDPLPELPELDLKGPGLTIYRAGDYNMQERRYYARNSDNEEIFVDKAIWQRYYQQIDESEGFDIKDFPGHGRMTTIVPFLDVSGYVIECAAEAVKFYNEKHGSTYELNEVLKVNGSGCQNGTYYITFTVTNDDKKCEYFQAKVVRRMNGSMKVLLVRPRANEGLDI